MSDTATIARPETAYDPLYMTDAEIIRRMGVPEKRARHLIKYFDDNPKLLFPMKDKLFGDRRYWPAVKAFLDKRNRLTIDASPRLRGTNV